MCLRTISVAALLVAFACGGSTPDEQARRTEPEPPAPVPQTEETIVPAPPPVEPVAAPPAARVVKVRVFHAAAAQSKAPISVRVGAQETATAPEYGEAATDTEARTLVVTGTNEQVVELRFEGIAQIARTHTLQDEDRISVFLVTPWGVDGTGPGVGWTSAPDRADAPPAGTIRVRFVNAMIGEESIDVCPDPEGREPVFPYVHYGVVDGMHGEDVPPSTVRYVEVPTASLPRWTIRRGAFDAPCRAPPFGSFTLPRGLDGQNVTLVWTGNSRGAPRRQLLACTDPPAMSACVPLPLRR